MAAAAFQVDRRQISVPQHHLTKWLGHADVSMVMHYYELHDDESRWTMNKLSLLDSDTSGKEATENIAEAG